MAVHKRWRPMTDPRLEQLVVAVVGAIEAEFLGRRRFWPAQFAFPVHGLPTDSA
jgi:hypothetical protein